MKKIIIPLLVSFILLYAARMAAIPGASFISTLIGGAVAKILYTKAKSPPAGLQNFARIVLGLSIGVTVNKQAAAAAASSFIPVMFTVVSLITLSLLCAWILTKLTGMDLATSLCGASPGAASAMVLLADEIGGDSAVVAAIHCIKILFILVFMPALTRLFPAENAALTLAAGEAFAVYYGKLAFLLIAGIIAAKLMRKGGFPTAEIIAGILTAAVCNPLFLNLESFPSLWQLFSVWIVGTGIGTQMSRESLKAAKKYALACAVLILALAGIGLVLGWILYKFTSLGILTSLLGTCPIGIDAMVILASELHTNVPLVAAMHSARVIIVVIVVPLLIRRTIAKKHRTV